MAASAQRFSRLCAGRVSSGLSAALLVAVAAGTGWLYLLRELHVLTLGPRLGGALPLQQLAGGDAQPLIRMTAAWLPAGVAAGIALGRAYAAAARRPGAWSAGLASLALLVLGSAVSDSIAQNDARAGAHLRRRSRTARSGSPSP